MKYLKNLVQFGYVLSYYYQFLWSVKELILFLFLNPCMF